MEELIKELMKEEFIGRYLYLYKNREFFCKLLTENNCKYLQAGCRVLEYILLGDKNIDTISEDEGYFEDLKTQFSILKCNKRFERKSGITSIYNKAKHITKFFLEKLTQNNSSVKPMLPIVVKGKKFGEWTDRPTDKEIKDFDNVVYNTEFNNSLGANIINSNYEYEDDYLNIIYILRTLYEYANDQDVCIDEDEAVKKDKLNCISKYLSVAEQYYVYHYSMKEVLNHKIVSASYPYTIAEIVIFRMKGDLGEKRNGFISYVSQNPILSEEEKKELYLRTNEEAKEKIK